MIESGNRDYELYKYLIDNGCKEAVSQSRILPLCKDNNDNSELIHLLVDNGALVDYFITLDSDGSCLYNLCNKPNLDFPLIKYLAEKKAFHNFDAKDKYNNTPLLLVCKNENASIPLIQCLIDNGADINAINKTGQTPLSILCEKENFQIPIIQYLVDKGANVNLGKNPPLNILCQKDKLDYDLIKYFIEKGANVNLGDEPILYHLCQQKTLNCDLIKIIVENGGNVNYSFKKVIRNYYNKIRIENFESKEIQSTIFKEICNHNDLNFSLFSLFLEHAADLRLYNPLSDICQNPKGTVDMIKLLQSKGVQLKEPNDPMNSLSLSSNPNTDIYFYLLKNDATFKNN